MSLISSGSSPPPWIKRQSYSRGIIGLHEEINDFYEIMSPTFQENKIRCEVVRLIEQIVTSLWPAARVEVFGSFKTGLFLPTSDIDIVVIGKWDRVPLHTLRNALITSGGHFDDVQLVPFAKVPLVRVVHSNSKVKVDISFNACTGLQSAELIMEFLKKYPTMSKLVYVLKQFLVCRRLNEVFYGGMSSYCLTLLVISFLQANHKPKSMKSINLGNLLMEFFELYGRNLSYNMVSIHIENGGYYTPKLPLTNSYLTIIDPLNADNDIAKGSYLMSYIKDAFENAYNCLHKSLTENHGTNPVSFLQLILEIDSQVLEQRQWLTVNFDSVYKNLLDFHHSRTQSSSNLAPLIVSPQKEKLSEKTIIPKVKKDNFKRKKARKLKSRKELLQKWIQERDSVVIRKKEKNTDLIVTGLDKANKTNVPLKFVPNLDFRFGKR